MLDVVPSLFGACAVALLAAAASIALCGFHLRLALARGWGQKVREDGPRSHLSKANTPSMGGVAFVAVIAISSIALAAAARTNGERMLVCGIAVAGVGLGLVGLWDDLSKITAGTSRGVPARWRILLQTAVASAAVALFEAARSGGVSVERFGFPVGLHDVSEPLAFAVRVAAIVGCANAVNFTDGVDGLAASTVALAAAGMVPVCIFAGSLQALFVAAGLAGAAAGFLVYNWHPARLFMGDVGSMTLGGTLGALAAAVGSELLLILLGGIFAIETLSVIAQVISFRLTGKRVLKMAPLHHHLELSGWSETKIVSWACVAQVVLSLLSAGVAAMVVGKP
ncbi:MAG: phospho-N-acetylmuramoyl-pentapeptide-transferase [Armatimonadetes bacterium]|nr:phospho-N-acetylmuramoyl-pentapeptide-transferase [Armatimonadota bacterium]